MTTGLLFQLQSSAILALMILGILWRRNRQRHIKTMAIVIIWDILLVLQIELTREAVLKATKAVTNPMILNIHVALAVSCVLAYLAMICTGRKILKGGDCCHGNARSLHKKLGIMTLLLRIAVFVTSFFAVIEK